MLNIDEKLLPFVERPDLSPFLIHLTKNTKAADGYSAFDNLVSMLEGGCVFESTSKKGFVKGPKGATCFMDVPLSSLKYVLNERNTKPEKPRYEPYGIVVSKEFAFSKGCRPVLYLSDEELSRMRIPKSEFWRVVRFESMDGHGVNWIHEREWRKEGAFQLPSKARAVLVKSTKEAERLRRIIDDYGQDFAVIPASIIPLSVLCEGLPYLHK
jgi:hypothetical protein